MREGTEESLAPGRGELAATPKGKGRGQGRKDALHTGSSREEHGSDVRRVRFMLGFPQEGGSVLRGKRKTATKVISIVQPKAR